MKEDRTVKVTQKLRVVPSKKEGHVVIIQVMPWDEEAQYLYEVPNEYVEATIEELKESFEVLARGVLGEGVVTGTDSSTEVSEDE